MRNALLVVKYEICSVISKPSFWLTTFLLPLMIIGVNVGSQLLVTRAVSDESQATMLAALASSQTVAYVDEAGLIQRVPPEVPAGVLHALPDQDAARAALEAGEISQYYVIPADFLESGELVLIVDKFAALAVRPGEKVMQYLLGFNLVDDPARAAALVEPMPRVNEQALARQEPSREDNPLTVAVCLATLLVFFFVLTFTGSFMLQSVTREKENRTAEVLLVSLRPRELMLGKILALAVVGLFQMAVWLGGGWLALGQVRQIVQAAATFTLPAGFFVWAVLYFLLGYLLYASALAGIGALAPTAREGNQAVFIMLVPLMVPLFVSTAFTQAPHGALATILSLFPLTAPVSMVTRLAVGGVPFWQPVVGLLGLAVTAYLMVALAGRLFRADTLLSSSALSWSRITQELRK